MIVIAACSRSYSLEIRAKAQPAECRSHQRPEVANVKDDRSHKSQNTPPPVLSWDAGGIGYTADMSDNRSVLN